MSTLQTTNLKHPDSASNQVSFTAGGDINFDSGAVFIDSSNNRVGIGTTGPGRQLQINGDSDTQIRVVASAGGTAGIQFGDTADTVRGGVNYDVSDNSLQLRGFNNSEALRIDGSGRLLVGTSTAPSDTANGAHYSKLVSVGNIASSTGDGRLALCRGKTASLLSSGNGIAEIHFADSAGGGFASISAFADGTPGADNYPGRLIFSTTPNNTSHPTEQLRINSIGRMTGHGVNINRIVALLYARLVSHSGCNSNGPSATFTEFDNGDESFDTVGKTTTTAPTGYQFIGDGYGNAFTVYVGCGDNVIFGTQGIDTSPNYHSWVLIHNSFVAAASGLPLNTTRTSLP